MGKNLAKKKISNFLKYNAGKDKFFLSTSIELYSFSRNFNNSKKTKAKKLSATPVLNCSYF